MSADEPRLYSEAIRNVTAIARQMSARWLLSESGSPHKKLVIIIHTGAVPEANATVQRIPGIRQRRDCLKAGHDCVNI